MYTLSVGVPQVIVEDTPFLRRGAISGPRPPGKPLNEGIKADVPHHQSHFSISQVGQLTLSKPTPVKSNSYS